MFIEQSMNLSSQVPRSTRNLLGLRQFQTTPVNAIKDYYRVLGLAKGATPDQIKTAYYAKAKIHHPDSNKGKSSVKFQEITEAYEVLNDDAKRRAYDTTFNSSSQQQQTSFYGQKPGPARPPSFKKEPINMHHIQHVYKTLNSDQVKEEPTFRPFDDHNYENSKFNRFEYFRHWDPNEKVWIYTKRTDAGEYYKFLARKQKRLRALIWGFTGLTLLFSINRMFIEV